MDALLIALVVAAYLLAGFVKGVIGMGLPTVAMGLLAAVMTPAQAAAILIAPSLATNIWQMVAGPYLLRPHQAARHACCSACLSVPGSATAF